MTRRHSISVALATFRGARFLPEQLASLAGQSRPPDELVVTDDCSDDGTAEILRGFQSYAPFRVVFQVNERRLGIPGNFNAALGLCRGDIVCLCDQDDVWLPDRLALSEAAFVAEPDLGMVFADLEIVGNAMQLLGHTQWERLGFDEPLQVQAASDLFGVLLRFNVVNGAAMAFHSRWLSLVLPVPDLWVQDEWIALLISAVAPTRFIDRTIVRYRQHASQSVGPGIRGVFAQYRYARRHMGAAYLARQADRTRQARNRLAQLANQYPIAEQIKQLDQRIEHFSRRATAREKGGVVGTTLSEWRRGNYRRFGYGWKGVVQDLLIR